MSIVETGEFSVLKKLRAAIWENLYWYIAYVVIVIIAAIVLVIRIGVIGVSQLSFPDVIGLLQAVSNAYGLILFTVLLGYGLVALPRHLWRLGSLQWRLKHYHKHAPSYASNAEERLLELVETLQEVRYVDMKLSDESPLRPLFNIVLKSAQKYMEKHKVGARSSVDFTKEINEKSLVKLHYNVLKAIRVSNQAS